MLLSRNLLQIPGRHYNPFNTHLGKIHDPRRWKDVGPVEAERFLWQQILTGDSTDAPSEFCGVQGVGDITAKKIIDAARKPSIGVSTEYVKKYGKKEGFKRANITYKMVKLAEQTDLYLPGTAKTEISLLLKSYKRNIKTKSDDIAIMFGGKGDPGKILFNK